MNADGKHKPIGKPHDFADNVEMAVGDGIERSRKKRNPLDGSGHDGGLARVPANRKAQNRPIARFGL